MSNVLMATVKDSPEDFVQIPLKTVLNAPFPIEFSIFKDDLGILLVYNGPNGC